MLLWALEECSLVQMVNRSVSNSAKNSHVQIM